MSIHRPSKLEFLVKFFNNIFHKRKLIVFIGVNGIIMATLKWQKIQDSIFISNIDEHKKRKYHKFLNKYKKYYITFLLDSKECVLKHEIMPIFNSLIKTNPVGEPPRGKPHGIKSASRVQAALARCLLSPVAQYSS